MLFDDVMVVETVIAVVVVVVVSVIRVKSDSYFFDAVDGDLWY